jgi:monofunctional biosynthetic peptidoglycan transglycosylase
MLLILLYLAVELATIPYFNIASLKTRNPSETALMRQRIAEAEETGKSLKIKYQWIPLSRIPSHALNAIVVAEDGLFYGHGGIDWFEVQVSLEQNVKKGKVVRGASTITQQLAKNLYLSTARTPARKLKEAIITILLEHQLDKQRILELYVNLIEWGRGIFGIDAAARTYFGKSASQLTLEEAARLAAVIPSPLGYAPNSNTGYVLRRKEIVLSRYFGREPADDLEVPEEEIPLFVQPAEEAQETSTVGLDYPDSAVLQAHPETTGVEQVPDTLTGDPDGF